MITYKLYDTKHILNVHKHVDGGFFWDKYSASPYMGVGGGASTAIAEKKNIILI